MYKHIVAFTLLSAAIGAIAPAGAQDKISGGVVKIGVLTDLSGIYMDNVGPGSVTASKYAIEDFGGKVLGKPIELVTADHLNKADVGANRAREWFDRFPTAAYMTEIEFWQELADGQIEFVMRRLPTSD